jgi:hypothetical protein
MAAIDIVAVDGKRRLGEFIEFPYKLYREDPHWVPPLRIAVKELLDRKKHPFYINAEAEFFLAYRDGNVVFSTEIITGSTMKTRDSSAFSRLKTTRPWPRRCSEPQESGYWSAVLSSSAGQ